MIDLVGSGNDVADRMGMLPRLRAVQTANTLVRYVDPAGRGRGWFDYRGFATALGGRAFTFMRGDLERVLYEALADRVPVRYATTVDAVTERAAATGYTPTVPAPCRPVPARVRQDSGPGPAG